MEKSVVLDHTVNMCVETDVAYFDCIAAFDAISLNFR